MKAKCRRSFLPLAALVFLLACCARGTSAQARLSNGTILEEEPFHLTVPYTEWLSRAYDPARVDPLDTKPDMGQVRGYYTAARYAALDGNADLRVDRIVYASDGLRIRGFRVAPKQHAAAKLPVIVWCHGGAGETGHIYTDELIRMSVTRDGSTKRDRDD